MFYMKHKGQKLPIRVDNVYTICPRCGREHHVDLGDVANATNGNFDIEDVHVFCVRCTAERERCRVAGLPVSYPND